VPNRIHRPLLLTLSWFKTMSIGESRHVAVAVQKWMEWNEQKAAGAPTADRRILFHVIFVAARAKSRHICFASWARRNFTTRLRLDPSRSVGQSQIGGRPGLGQLGCIGRSCFTPCWVSRFCSPPEEISLPSRLIKVPLVKYFSLLLLPSLSFFVCSLL